MAFHSRTDADTLRSKRGPGWSDTRFNPYLRRSWREMGQGDRVELGTPRSRQMATKRAEREAIAEGLAEHLDTPTTGLPRDCEAVTF